MTDPAYSPRRFAQSLTPAQRAEWVRLALGDSGSILNEIAVLIVDDCKVSAFAAPVDSESLAAREGSEQCEEGAILGSCAPCSGEALTEDELAEIDVMHRNGWGIDEARDELLARRGEVAGYFDWRGSGDHAGIASFNDSDQWCEDCSAGRTAPSPIVDGLDCLECVMTWLLHGDGAICLACRQPVVWKGSK